MPPVFLVVFVAAVLSATGAWAQALKGRYYVVVWGYQGEPNHPEDSHTFVTFYRGDDLARGANDPLTISWLPATRVIRAGRVERGRNFSLGETLRIARSRGYEVRAYGPYAINGELYRRASERVRALNLGRWKYTMINGPEGAMNCIAAAGELGGPIFTGFNYGYSASLDVVNHLSHWMPEGPRVVTHAATILAIDAIVERTRTSAPQRDSPLPDMPAADVGLP